MSKFVLCADDFGLSPGINAAVRDLIAAGRLSATSVMVGGDHVEAGAALLAPLADRADIGLHVTLTDLAPLGPMPRLMPGGTIPSLGQIILASLGGRLDYAEIGAELGRQLDRFEALFGRKPDFIDGHQHVHVLPVIRRALLDLFRGGRLDAAKVWVRVPADPMGQMLRGGVLSPKIWTVAGLSLGLRTALARAGVRSNGCFRGFTEFRSDGSFGRVLAADLARPGPAMLAMCHPASSSGGMTFQDGIAAARRDEYAYLAAPQFGEDLARLGLEVARFRDL